MQNAIDLGVRAPTASMAVRDGLRATAASDVLYRAAAWIAGGVGVLIPVAILAYLAWNGLAAVTTDFLLTPPTGSSLDGKGGILPAIKGSLALVGLGLIPALLLGIGGGVYLAEFNRSQGFEHAARFRDMETAEEVMAVPDSIRQDYIDKVQERIAFYRRELGLVGIDYCQLDTSQPLELGLMSYLMTRRRVL